MQECPHCRSTSISRDTPGLWLLLLSISVLPFSLLLLFLNRNRFCTVCGVRFRLPETRLAWWHMALIAAVPITVLLWVLWLLAAEWWKALWGKW